MSAETSAAGIVIIGAGQAGVMTAEALRTGGFEGPITMLGDEPHGPYHRPPLSKAWMAGEIEAAQLVMRAPEMLVRKNIALRTGVNVKAIDRSAQTVILGDGSALPYTGLVLATGSTPRALPLPGSDAPGVMALRTRDDASAIADRLAACIAQQRPVVVIGGGFIGLEVAATARKKGLAVTVLEAAPRLLGRVLAPVLSDWYAELHRGHGVQLLLGKGPACYRLPGHTCVPVAGVPRRRLQLRLVEHAIQCLDRLASSQVGLAEGITASGDDPGGGGQGQGAGEVVQADGRGVG